MVIVKLIKKIVISKRDAMATAYTRKSLLAIQQKRRQIYHLRSVIEQTNVL